MPIFAYKMYLCMVTKSPETITEKLRYDRFIIATPEIGAYHAFNDQLCRKCERRG